MQIKPFKALTPRTRLIGSPTVFCDHAKNEFVKYIEKGLYNRLNEDALYVYQIEHGFNKHIGLVGLNHVDDFLEGKVKKHEETLHEKEEKQRELFLRWKAILKPVLVTFKTVPELQWWLEYYTQTCQPINVVRFDQDHETHRFWAVTKPEDIQHLQKLLSERVPVTYIADGHHRSSTTAWLYQTGDTQGLDFSHLFCAWFAADQLDILDYNRVVEGLKKIGPATLMARLSRVFEIEVLETMRRPAHKHEIMMYLDKTWYALNWKHFILQQTPKGYDTLDADLLNDMVIEKIFEINDVRSDTRIRYVEGSRGMQGVQKLTNAKSKDRVGFVLFPVSFEDMARIADSGECLPPKSTYFEPRLKSGLLVRLLEG
ncbi:MAG: DUF1015 domain-containing protein [Saprospiraceae bacterium]|nr:DUF1015 domain-containing protein [Saprospiraceae bacterium]